jgi:hypothetical protein
VALRLEISLPPQIALDLDPRKVRAVLRSAGSEIAALARRKVRQGVGAGKTYYGAEKGKHRASLPGQPGVAAELRSAGRRALDGIGKAVALNELNPHNSRAQAIAAAMLQAMH